MAETKNSDSNLWAAIAALLGIIGLVIMLLKPGDKHIRFYAIQSAAFTVVAWIVSIILSMIILVIAFIPFAGIAAASLISSLYGIVLIVIWLFQAWKAYSGEHWKMPILGDIVEKNFMK